MEADIVTMTNKEKITQGHINNITKELEETKLHIRLADMLRKTIGVSHQERLFLETKLQAQDHTGHKLDRPREIG
jgi:ABC-type ATPase involved in cell division